MITEVLAAEVPALREELIALCAQAFGRPPWHDPPSRSIRQVDRMLTAAAEAQGFCCVTATDEAGALTGFACGWTDSFCARLSGAADDIETAFELAELAVAPAHQGRGLGHALHDALLADAPTPRLLLTLPVPELRDRYERWGWRVLDEIVMKEGETPYALMRQS